MARKTKIKKILKTVKRHAIEFAEDFRGLRTFNGKKYKWIGYLTNRGKAERKKEHLRQQGFDVRIVYGKYSMGRANISGFGGGVSSIEERWDFYISPYKFWGR